jgi:hypothetical protein
VLLAASRATCCVQILRGPVAEDVVVGLLGLDMTGGFAGFVDAEAVVDVEGLVVR